MFKKWGFDAPNDDEADAYVLAQMARGMLLINAGLEIDAGLPSLF